MPQPLPLLSRLARLQRAEYWWRPAQLLRRACRVLRGSRPGDTLPVRLPWGHRIDVDPGEAIGRALAALDVFDLPSSEAIWRLLDDGEAALDVGANVGYMTSLMAARLRQGGAVWAFEPLPEIASILEKHAARWTAHSRATIHVERRAVSDSDAPVQLWLPPDFQTNRGSATIERAGGAGLATSSVTVDCCRLDAVLTGNGLSIIGVLKVDVEGAEARVFRGAGASLEAGRIRDIVFEEYAPYPAPSHRILEEHRYKVWRLARSFWKPILLPPDSCPDDNWESPAYLATREPERARHRLASPGWQCLR